MSTKQILVSILFIPIALGLSYFATLDYSSISVPDLNIKADIAAVVCAWVSIPGLILLFLTYLRLGKILKGVEENSEGRRSSTIRR